MISMTGYSRAQKETQGTTIDVALRSVNSRFLDLRFHLPRELGALEHEFRKKIQAQISRGTIDIYVHWTRLSPHSLNLMLNKNVAKKWLSLARELAKESKLSTTDLSVKDVLSLPHVIAVNEVGGLSNSESVLAHSVFETALNGLVKSRKVEGKALAVVIKKNLLGIKNTIEHIRKHETEIRSQLEKRLTERFSSISSEIGQKMNIDPQRFHQELVIQIEKADVSEELDRLNEHLKTCLEKIEIEGQLGKTLEFYCQEILREINTLGSKLHTSQLTQRVVEAKTLVEGLREQVQNVE